MVVSQHPFTKKANHMKKSVLSFSGFSKEMWGTTSDQTKTLISWAVSGKWWHHSRKLNSLSHMRNLRHVFGICLVKCPGCLLFFKCCDESRHFSSPSALGSHGCEQRPPKASLNPVRRVWPVRCCCHPNTVIVQWDLKIFNPPKLPILL